MYKSIQAEKHHRIDIDGCCISNVMTMVVRMIACHENIDDDDDDGDDDDDCFV